MTERSKNLLWIVLVQKSPIGPLTETQIREKLSSGEIRINDLAHSLTGELPPEELPEGKLPSDWRFLWQFPQFDRRKTEGKKPAEGDRRKSTVTEAETAAKKVLGSDFKEVSSKELLAHTKSAWARERRSPAYHGRIAEPAPRKPFAENRWILWPGALLVAAVVLPALLGFNVFPATNAVRPVPSTAQDGAGRTFSHSIQKITQLPADLAPPLERMPAAQVPDTPRRKTPPIEVRDPFHMPR